MRENVVWLVRENERECGVVGERECGVVGERECGVVGESVVRWGERERMWCGG